MLLPPREAPLCHHDNPCRALGPSSPRAPSTPPRQVCPKTPWMEARGHLSQRPRPGTAGHTLSAWRLVFGDSLECRTPESSPRACFGLRFPSLQFPGGGSAQVWDFILSDGCWLRRPALFTQQCPSRHRSAATLPRRKAICFLPRSINTVFLVPPGVEHSALQAEPPSWPPEPQLHSHRDPAGGAAWVSQEEPGQCSSCGLRGHSGGTSRRRARGAPEEVCTPWPWCHDGDNRHFLAKVCQALGTLRGGDPRHWHVA